MTKNKQNRKLEVAKKSNNFTEEQLEELCGLCKMQYPHLPDIVINAVCCDYLMNPYKRQWRYQTDKAFKEQIDKIQNQYDNKVYVYNGVSIE